MPKSSTPDALIVHLIVDDEPGLRERKFARRCAEARQLFMEVLRPLNAGPLAPNSPTIGVKGQADVKAVIDFAKTNAGRRLIFAFAPMPISTPFVEEVKPKKWKNPDDGVEGFAADLTDEEDEMQVNESVEADD